jgi:uncharacterized repeat protein (TIGR02543 family)
MSSILRYPKQIGPSDQYIAISNLQTLAAKACEFISTNPAYVGNSKGFIIPATPQLFGAIENFNSDSALVPVLRDMGKQVFAPMATSLSNGFAGQVTGSGYFEEVQLLLPKPIVYPPGFIGGPSGNAFGVVGSSPDLYTPYLTFYLPKTLGGTLGIPIPYYTVTYDLNGGSGTAPPITSYRSGTIVTVADGNNLSYSGFIFTGWRDNIGILYSIGANVMIQRNVILYAQWKYNLNVSPIGISQPIILTQFEIKLESEQQPHQGGMYIEYHYVSKHDNHKVALWGDNKIIYSYNNTSNKLNRLYCTLIDNSAYYIMIYDINDIAITTTPPFRYTGNTPTIIGLGVTLHATIEESVLSIQFNGGDSNNHYRVIVIVNNVIRAQFEGNPPYSYTLIDQPDNNVVIESWQYKNTQDESNVYSNTTFTIHKIIYSTNDSSINPPTSSFFIQGQMNLLPRLPSSNGKTFVGWNTKSDGTGEMYSNSINPMSSMTLYSIFTPVIQSILTFHINGVDWNPIIDLHLNQTYTLPSYGTYFLGWNTKLDGTGTMYNGSITLINPILLFAIYTCTVTFDINGAQIDIPQPKTVYSNTIPFNQSCLLPHIQYGAYTFAGWNTKSDGTGVMYNDSFVPTESMTLYAIFTSIITFIMATIPTTFTTDPITINQSYTLPSFPSSTYTFAGWNTTPDGTGIMYHDIIIPTASMTLYSIFTYTITFNVSGVPGILPLPSITHQDTGPVGLPTTIEAEFGSCTISHWINEDGQQVPNLYQPDRNVTLRPVYGVIIPKSNVSFTSDPIGHGFQIPHNATNVSIELFGAGGGGGGGWALVWPDSLNAMGNPAQELYGGGGGGAGAYVKIIPDNLQNNPIFNIDCGAGGVGGTGTYIWQFAEIYNLYGPTYTPPASIPINNNGHDGNHTLLYCTINETRSLCGTALGGKGGNCNGTVELYVTTQLNNFPDCPCYNNPNGHVGGRTNPIHINGGDGGIGDIQGGGGGGGGCTRRANDEEDVNAPCFVNINGPNLNGGSGGSAGASGNTNDNGGSGIGGEGGNGTPYAYPINGGDGGGGGGSSDGIHVIYPGAMGGQTNNNRDGDNGSGLGAGGGGGAGAPDLHYPTYITTPNPSGTYGPISVPDKIGNGGSGAPGGVRFIYT